MNAEHLTVRIYGENYPLRTAEPAARLEELARYVDARMREVAASGKVVVTSKIAVLAALHIADELFRLRERPRHASDRNDYEDQVSALALTLERALATPPDNG
ncbi:MAG: cell division protein ZapA [Candidatus Methylomirabilia bacterium]